jgi:hypothetical protein
MTLDNAMEPKYINPVWSACKAQCEVVRVDIAFGIEQYSGTKFKKPVEPVWAWVSDCCEDYIIEGE